MLGRWPVHASLDNFDPHSIVVIGNEECHVVRFVWWRTVHLDYSGRRRAVNHGLAMETVLGGYGPNYSSYRWPQSRLRGCGPAGNFECSPSVTPRSARAKCKRQKKKDDRSHGVA
jgi:hypothetical protein